MVSEEEFRRRMEEKPPAEYFDLMKHGEGLFESWTELAFQDPPEDILGRILWSAGILGQLVVSMFTFPAALGAFLLEEAVQSYGMGAYMLSTAKAYELADPYIDDWIKFIDSAEVGAKTLALLSPITGGAVLVYMDAAKHSALAFQSANDINLLKQAETDEKLRKKLEDNTKYAKLRLQSSPSQAQIFMNGKDLELLTPETFTQMDAGPYTILLKKYSAARKVEETFEFDITLEAGYKKEIFVRIPQTVDGVPGTAEDPTETEEPQLPTWIKAEVRGDYAIDGDTFTTSTGERIRILGIDAPETGRPWADVAGAYLDDLIHDKKVSLKIQGHKPLDTHGRTLAVSRMYKGDIAELLLSSGYARLMVFDDDKYDPMSYKLAEDMAKERKIGIWS